MSKAVAEAEANLAVADMPSQSDDDREELENNWYVTSKQMF